MGCGDVEGSCIVGSESFVDVGRGGSLPGFGGIGIEVAEDIF